MYNKAKVREAFFMMIEMILQRDNPDTPAELAETIDILLKPPIVPEQHRAELAREMVMFILGKSSLHSPINDAALRLHSKELTIRN